MIQNHTDEDNGHINNNNYVTLDLAMKPHQKNGCLCSNSLDFLNHTFGQICDRLFIKHTKLDFSLVANEPSVELLFYV